MGKTISIYMDEKLHEELKAMAEKEMRPVSNLIEYIIRQYLAEMDKKLSTLSVNTWQ